MLGCFILAVFVVGISFASRGDGVAGMPDSAVACEDGTSLLSVFPLVRIRPGDNGSASGLEVHFSSADGHCSELVFSSLASGDRVSSDVYQDFRDQAISLR